MEWAEKGVRKEDYVRPYLRRMGADRQIRRLLHFPKHGAGAHVFAVQSPKFPTDDPNHRILAQQRSRFTHYYFYVRDEILGPMVMRVATFFPFQTTYYLNGHSFIEQELKRAQDRFSQKR